MDPRGVGGSEQVECLTEARREAILRRLPEVADVLLAERTADLVHVAGDVVGGQVRQQGRVHVLRAAGAELPGVAVEGGQWQLTRQRHVAVDAREGIGHGSVGIGNPCITVAVKRAPARRRRTGRRASCEQSPPTTKPLPS